MPAKRVHDNGNERPKVAHYKTLEFEKGKNCLHLKYIACDRREIACTRFGANNRLYYVKTTNQLSARSRHRLEILSSDIAGYVLTVTVPITSGPSVPVVDMVTDCTLSTKGRLISSTCFGDWSGSAKVMVAVGVGSVSGLDSHFSSPGRSVEASPEVVAIF